MKFNIINKKKIVLILISGFVIVTMTGCQNKSKPAQIEQPLASNVQIEEKVVNDSIVEEKVIQEPIVVKEVIQETNESEEKVDNVITSLNQMELEVDNELLKESNESSKNKLKDNFIKVVDFVFLGTEINGKTFKELTDEQKEQVLSIIDKIDNKIMTKYPTYKEDIGNVSNNIYVKASELIKKGMDNVKEFTYDILGEENYNSFIEGKDKLVENTKKAASTVADAAGDVYDKGKEKVKSWYDNFKK